MPRKMDNYIIDLDSFMNIDNGNGILLSKYEIELLLKYDIDYRNYSDIESLLFVEQNTNIQVGGLLFSGILIAALGAVMDVAM